jgi:hypothetical protein
MGLRRLALPLLVLLAFATPACHGIGQSSARERDRDAPVDDRWADVNRSGLGSGTDRSATPWWMPK